MSRTGFEPAPLGLTLRTSFLYYRDFGYLVSHAANGYVRGGVFHIDKKGPPIIFLSNPVASESKEPYAESTTKTQQLTNRAFFPAGLQLLCSCGVSSANTFLPGTIKKKHLG